MVLAWGNLHEVFVMFGVVVVILRFRASVPCYRHSTLVSQAREGLHQLWALPWLLSVALLLPGFFLRVLRRALRFWAGVFYPQAFFCLELLPHILARFCDSDVGRNTPSRILLCACPHKVVPSGWHMDLNYSYCRYKTNGLPIAQSATKYRVTKLLNMFQPTYASLKTMKALWTRCLKLLQWNCFLSIHQS